MTTANIMDLSKSIGTVTPGGRGRNSDLVKKTEDAAAAMFGSLMNQFGNADAWETSGDPVRQEPSAGIANADRTEYRESGYRRSVSSVTEADAMRDRVRAESSRVEETGEQIVQAVSEQMNVTPEEVTETLERLGFTPFDLLNPANLGTAVMELTGTEEPAQLLMNPDFLGLIQDVGVIADELVNDFAIEPGQLDELVARMNVSTADVSDQIAPENAADGKSFGDILQDAFSTMNSQTETGDPAGTIMGRADQAADTVASPAEAAVSVQGSFSATGQGIPLPQEFSDSVQVVTRQETPVSVEQQDQTVMDSMQEIPEMTVEASQDLPHLETVSQPVAGGGTEAQASELQGQRVLPEEMNTQDIRENAEEDTETLIRRLLRDPSESEPDAGQDDTSSQSGAFSQGREAQGMPEGIGGRMTGETAGNVTEPVHQQFLAADVSPDAVVNETPGYSTVDPAEVIAQIVQNVRSAVQSPVTTLEMQLNPEHLGKVLVQLTSREGAVNAQFTAANEAVRAALETQIASLRENLSQAGVKVDAIEVTVSAHEFEQNLEQNARGEAEQAEQQSQQQKGRRNLSLDTLDELSGVMTEEERLVAQMMQDNGNSMDVTA